MKLTLTIIFIILLKTYSSAQESINSAGANRNNSSGSVNFSVGQYAVQFQKNTTGSISEGVQQAYQITTNSPEDESDIQIELTIFPNPTTNQLVLHIPKDEFIEFYYNITDLSGKPIFSKKINSNSTTITFGHLPSSTYFLQITEHSLPIKTFKIIKN